VFLSYRHGKGTKTVLKFPKFSNFYSWMLIFHFASAMDQKRLLAWKIFSKKNGFWVIWGQISDMFWLGAVHILRNHYLGQKRRYPPPDCTWQKTGNLKTICTLLYQPAIQINKNHVYHTFRKCFSGFTSRTYWYTWIPTWEFQGIKK